MTNKDHLDVIYKLLEIIALSSMEIVTHFEEIKDDLDPLERKIWLKSLKEGGMSYALVTVLVEKLQNEDF